MTDNNSPIPVQSPEIRRNFGISPLWLLPILTMALAGWLLMKSIQDAGQRIQIHFSDAQGLIAGRTPIRYQGLEVGMVRDINLAEDLSDIFVDADIYPEAIKLLSENTRFWLVKPTASLSGVSGLDALVSGNYVAIDPGNESEVSKTEFVALEQAPSDLHAKQGLNLTLKANSLAGINIGSQIVFKKIPIGEVYSYQLNPEDKSLSIQAYVKEQYRGLINDNSRFWNASGVNAELGFQGLNVHIESLSAIIGGAIAVDSPQDGKPIADSTEFTLYPDLSSAGRGIPISVQLPEDHGITGSQAPIIYRGIEIGEITSIHFDKARQNIYADAVIEPAYQDLLTQGAMFVVEELEVSLKGLDNLSNLVTGNYISLIQGGGDSTTNFVAITKVEQEEQNLKTDILTLAANESFGLSKGNPLLYRGVAVGHIVDIELDRDQVRFKVAVERPYADLVRSKSRFFIDSHIRAELSEKGLDVTLPNAKQVLLGGITFTSEGSQTNNTSFTLFASKALAELASQTAVGNTQIELIANKLPPVQAGSPVLYRNLQVGEVVDYRLANEGIIIKLSLEKSYDYLLNPNTVFWNYSGVRVDASLEGVKIEAAPIKSLINGGIAFDTLPNVSNRTGDKWTLFESFDAAKRSGAVLTLLADKDVEASVGTPIRYRSVEVGEITEVIPNFTKETLVLKAIIDPLFINQIAKEHSVFWVSKPIVALTRIENLESLIDNSIQVQPGSGKQQTRFQLQDKPPAESSVRFVLQSENKGSVTEGTPILYRGIEVGQVDAVHLGEVADRVLFDVTVSQEYAYLIRTNTLFWNASGFDVSIGLTGADIRAGSLDSIVRGGISFATPESKVLKPQAQAGRSFYLHPTAKQDWSNWRTAIPKP